MASPSRPFSGRPGAKAVSHSLARWDLVADGEHILTQSSRLLPVWASGLPAMLKLSADPQDHMGGALMEW